MSTPAYTINPPASPQFVLPAGTTWAQVVTPPPEPAAWYVYREALARMTRGVYEAHGVPSIVRAGWHLRLKIGETLALLKNGPVQTPRKREGEGEVRGVMFNFDRFMQPPPAEQTIGTHDLAVTCGVTVWIVHQYSRRTPELSAQAQVERECRLLMWMVRQNTKLGLAGAAAEVMQDVLPLNFPAVDLHGFSDGTECFIAQGSTALTLVEQDTRPEVEP